MARDAHDFAQAWSARLCGALLFGLGLSASVQAASAQAIPAKAVLAEDQRAEFDIPTQAIDKALDRFGAITGFQVFYEAGLTAGRQSRSVKGAFDPAAALRRLLDGSGLTARVIAARTITIVQADEIGTELHRAKRAALASYGVMQAAVTAALCQNTETRPGAYRITMQYWIDPSGQVSRVRLIGSSGNQARDDAIVRVLQTVVLQLQPAQMPQPVTLAIEPGEQGGAAACAPNGVETARMR